MGNCSKRGKCGSAPTQKTSGGRGWWAGPTSMIGSPVGNQACIVPRLLWDLLLLKLPHPEASKCLLGIFIFLKSGLDLPGMEHSWFDHFSLYIANILLWYIQQHSLLCLQKITTQNKLCIVKEDHLWCKGPRKTIRACPGKGRAALLLREWPRSPFSSTGFL